MPPHGTQSAAPRAQLGSRAQFPHLEARAYLAHAAISPPSLPVQDAVAAVLGDYARGGVRAYPAWAAQRVELRHDLASLLGVEATSIALTAGTTRGLVDVALAVRFRPGERIVCFSGEFPANVTPWQRAAARFGLELTWLDAEAFRLQPAAALAALDRELEQGVRLLAVSAVEFQTGFRMPLAEIGERCRAYGTLFAVDAVQACGIVPAEAPAWGADFLAGGAHKWLMGIEGAGFLYVHPDRVGELEPATAGWLSHEHGADFLFQGAGHLRYDRPLKRTVEVFEGGTLAAAGFAALGAGVATLLELGVEAIAAHVERYLDRLEPALAARGLVSLREPERSRRSGILSVALPPHADVVAWQRGLLARGIVTSIPDGLLRFAPHWPNALDEVDAVVEALDELVAPGV